MIKRILYCVLFAGALILPVSCKKFLTVQPLDRLSDASFWKTQSDVESAIADAYGHLFDVLTEGPYLPFSGDDRAGEFVPSNGFSTWVAIAHNDLTFKIYPSQNGYYHVDGLTNWYSFYQSIAECNIDIEKIPEVKALTTDEVNRYEAEVHFIRDFAYFIMSRLYGDVPLYTKAYDTRALPRTPMVDVLQFCLNDLNEIKDNVPWQYDDPTQWGVRAARGSIYALMANINMWLAGFDKANQTKYWQSASDEVTAIINSGQFSLLPIENFRQIFQGRTRESLFEFEINANYSTSGTSYVTIGEWTLHEPIIPGYTQSDLFFNGNYLAKIYPPNVPDKRRDLWFYLPYVNNNQCMFLKFSNVINLINSYSWRLEDNLIIFRYGGIILLGAEAMADLGENGQAIQLLNEIRARAEAPLYNSSDGDLKEFIFQERQRELIGEGVFWYDLVRTGKVMDPNECADPLTPQQFAEGAWTWPIDPSARVNNPNITLNTYWTK